MATLAAATNPRTSSPFKGRPSGLPRLSRLSRLRGLRLLLHLFLIFTPFPAAASPACPHLTSPSAKDRMADLEQQVRFHNDLYYKSLRPAITDAQYDLLFAELVQLEQCFPSLAGIDSPTGKVGTDSGTSGPSLRHERPMLSLTSSTGPEAVAALLQRAATKESKPGLLLQPKVDGLPVELLYRSGRLVSAATRGDGRLGADVTKRVREITGIPLRLSGRFPDRVTVRGEIYAERGLMAKATAGRSKRYATPRHFAAATLRSQHPAPLALAALRLFPFELVAAENVPGISSDLAALGALSRWGFPVRPDLTLQVRSLDQIKAAYQKYLAQRSEHPFATDGIVVKIDHLALRRSLGEGSRAPFWAAAWKFPPETARTVVRAIRWKQGRTGRRTPVAEVVPVTLAGVVVSHVTLHNEQTVQRLCIEAGDRVVIGLVADIIPQLLEVEREQGDGACPEEASVVATPEAGIAACLSDAPGCREQFLARVVHFASGAGLDIPGLGPGRLRRLVESGLVRDLPSLFLLKQEEVASVSGFTDQSARRLTEALSRVGRPEPFRLVAALGIAGIGPVTARRLANRFDSLDALLSSQQEKPDCGEAVQNIRSFFGSSQGQELLRGLREANLL